MEEKIMSIRNGLQGLSIAPTTDNLEILYNVHLVLVGLLNDAKALEARIKELEESHEGQPNASVEELA